MMVMLMFFLHMPEFVPADGLFRGMDLRLAQPNTFSVWIR
jgi:hypothetical protein